MSYIYRYQLRNKNERQACDLRRYKRLLDKTLNKCFSDLQGNETYYVEKEYFEFRTYKKKTNKDLQDMGREIKYIFNNVCNHGFVRSKIKYYAYLSKEHSSNEITAEIVEFNDLKNALQKYRSEQMEEINKEHIISELDLGALFINLDNAYNNNFPLSDNLSQFNNEWCIIEGINRTYNNKNIVLERDLINYNSTTDQIENIDIQNRSDVEDEGFLITNVEELSEEEIKQINDLFEFKYETVLDFKTIKDDFTEMIDKSEKLIIKNVGQGLSCSICDKDDKANIYFDIGRGAGENKKTTPANLIYRFDNNPIIILSHIDEDHWASVREFQQALDMKWIVPNQKPKVRLRKKYSIISRRHNLYVMAGTRVNINSSNLIDSFILFKGTGNTTHTHNNGFSIFIKLKNEIVILLPGDNRYEYINNIYKNNINILCATHHGGEYTGHTTAILPSPNQNKKIIYSYGDGNTYEHPSKCADYQLVNWNNKHDTPCGEYIYNFNSITL